MKESTSFEGIQQMIDERIKDAANNKSIQELIDSRISEILDQRLQKNSITLCCFSGDMDRLMATFIIATGAAAMGMQVSMFFAFWGLVALKKETRYKGKPFMDKMMAAMLPNTASELGVSRMNMFGMGAKFFKKVMKDKSVSSLPELIQVARDMGIKLVACQMAMNVMGITREELFEDVEYGGIAGYLGDAMESKITLFI